MKRIISLLFVLIALVAIPAMAQSPVRWRTFVKATGDGEGLVTFRALVADGWHLYGLDLPENGPKPTTFDLSASKDIRFSGKVKPSRKAVEINDPMFGMKLSWWDADIEFSIPFKITGPTPELKCKINYMACDGTTCCPPATETVSIPVKLDKK